MPGIRIRPADDRKVPDNSMIVIRDQNRPFHPPKDGRSLESVQAVCSICGVQHFCKTYHLQLRAGSVIVSTTVWAKMQAMPDNGGFIFVNVVGEPPAQGIGPGAPVGLIEKFSAIEISTIKKRGRLATFLFGDNKATANAGEGGK